MKIRTKILCGFIVMAVIAVILGGAGLIATMSLDNITTELKELQHESDSVSNVLNAHYVWRQSLTESVLLGVEFTGSLNPHTCALGVWHDSDEARNMRDPTLLAMLASLDDPHEFIHTEAANVVALMRAGDTDGATEYLNNVIFPKTAEVISILSNMQSRYNSIVVEKDEESIRVANTMQVVTVVLTILALGIAIFLAFFISRMISAPLAPLSAFMKKAGSTGDISLVGNDAVVIEKYSRNKDEIGECIAGAASLIGHITSIAGELETLAGGDLTLDVELLSDKDTMGQSLARTVDNLNEMFREINVSTSQVSTGSKQVADGAQTLAQGSTQQAASIEELSSSIAEIADKTKANAEIADKTAKLAEAIIGSAEKGSRQMDEMMEAVREINQASQSISRVIKVIDDIAFQTNILALNAAVEAARAGEHGKGFAVVAEEVRNLASKSAEAAKETGAMIENSMEKAGLGARIAEETAASLAEIVSGIDESSRFVKEIAKASEEQTLGIEQINTGIDQVAQVVQQNSATAEESAAASEEMSGQSHILEELIRQFKVKNAGPGQGQEAYRGMQPKRAFVPGPSYALGSGDGYDKY
ncbi:MAG: methyl-accepting chemotaxis protein [Clostridiales bacterium]|nr:methyl-accepting chemotaxis protein [Clostridiales bacterium]